MDRGADQVQGSTAGNAGRDSIGGNQISGNISARGSVVGGNQSNTNSKKTVISFGGIVLVVAVLAGLFFLGKFLFTKAGDFVGAQQISADTSCGDYLRRSDSDRSSAVRSIALQLHVKGAGSPLMFPEVDYECGGAPNTKLGTVIGRQKGY